VYRTPKKILLKHLLMIGRVGDTDGRTGEWKKLVDVQESGRNWWMYRRVEETGGCMGEWKKLVDAWGSGRNWLMHGRV